MNPGTVVAGRFVVEALAGEGGMSVVYRATDRLTGGLVALKVLRDNDGLDPERFVREALVLAELSHPAIVRYIAHGNLDDRPYLVMEWMLGEDLDARLQRAGLTLGESVALARRVCEALAAAHARGIVHRDIKPPNLFLPDGDVARVKVLDFGIARRRRGTHAATRTGTVLGTPGYMAPEQVRGERAIDARADVFSLGCVLWECLTGRPAFEGDTPVSILARILLEDAPLASSVRPELPADLDALVAAMVARDPAQRPRDASAVIARLDELAPFEAQGAPSVAVAPQSLTHGERRLVCAMAVGVPASRSVDRSATYDHTQVSVPSALPTGHLASVAEAHGGHLEVLGDTLLVVFAGHGVARDLASRAARCALAFAPEVASATVALALGRAELRQGFAVGEAIDRAFALLDGCPPEAHGRIVAEPVLAALVKDAFVFERSTESVFLVGDRDALPCGVAAWERGACRGLLGRPMPCVGRERELGTLDAILAETVAGERASAVLVTGAAGSGKTRLVEEFLRRALAAHGGAGLEVWYARGDLLGAGASFGLVAPMLRAAAGVMHGEGFDASRARLRARFAPTLAAAFDAERATTTLLWLGELAGVPFDESEAPWLRAARADAQWMGDGMLRAWEDLVAAETAARPLVVVFDNVHWGDAVSLRFVDGALRAHAERPWMVVAAGRDETLEAFPKLWEGRDVQHVRLGDLGRRAAERMVRHALGDKADDAVVARLVERSGGSPLFLEELLRAAAEGATSALPESVLAMVQARVEALEPEARRVLRAASVFGQTFWRGGVAALLSGRPATPGTTAFTADGGAVDEWLDELARREVLARAARSRFPGEVEWTFRHDLLREAAYSMLTAHDRALGHALAGRWLRDSGAREPLALADHFARGEQHVDAAAQYLDAARQALDGHDLDAALARVAQGLACCERAVTLDERADLRHTDGLLRVVESDALLWRGEPVKASGAAREALALLPEGSAEWFYAIGLGGTALGRMGRLDDARAWVARAVAVPPTDRAVEEWAIALARVAVHFYHLGDVATADPLLALVGPRVDALAASSGLGVSPRVEARIAGARASRAVATRDADGIYDESLRAMEAYERAGDQRNQATQLTVLAMACARNGLYDEAAAFAERALPLARALNIPMGVGMTLRPLAAVRFARGERARAIEETREAVAVLAPTEHPRIYCAALCDLAWMLFEAGDLAGAAREARKVVEHPAATAPFQQHALATLARVARSEGRRDDALALARRAAQPVAPDGSLIEAGALADLAWVEALVAHGDTGEARDAAAAAVRRLEAAAPRFRREEWRRRYFTDVPIHAALVALARSLGA